jgi:hypothetical protein
LAVLAAVAAGCSAGPNDISATREGSVVRLTAPGWTDANTSGWLCPADPGPGTDTGAARDARLAAAGCVALVRSDPAPGANGWSGTFDINTLGSDQLSRFPIGGTYRLVLVAEAGGDLHELHADISSLSLVP